MITFISALILCGLYGYYNFKLRKENEKLRKETASLFETKEEMKLSLLLGLYHQYKKEEDSEKAENPLQFERFVARVIEGYYPGDTYVTRSSGDYGVDIEQRREDGLYLGQVKCYALNNPVNYEPIAIIHSQMEKQNAAGGFVVTTSRFTPNAIKYAADLKIELIDGLKLIDMWTSGTEKQYRKYLESLNNQSEKQIVN